MKLDLLAFGAHPDDVELAGCGTVMAHIALGKKAGIVDLTKGELGTRGSAELREQEAKKSAAIMGLSVRENLNMRDGFFVNDETNQLKVIEILRKYQPEIILCNSEFDRHIDHGRGAALVHDACFLSGLRKVVTHQNGKEQTPWRPRAVYHFIQDYHTQPDVIVDITPYFDKKISCIKSFSSQFYNPDSQEPESPISTKDFFHFIEARAREFGRPIGATFAEAFTVKRPIGVSNLAHLL
jgi:N-acetylglucosamine malate deacetylase 1